MINVDNKVVILERIAKQKRRHLIRMFEDLRRQYSELRAFYLVTLTDAQFVISLAHIDAVFDHGRDAYLRQDMNELSYALHEIIRLSKVPTQHWSLHFKM
jgi:vacuolar-type H+-ATPase subunit D/Vma8